MINKDGINNHNGMIGNRRTKRIGEHINRMFRKMKEMYARVQHSLNEGSTIEDVQRVSKTCKYYDLLFPTIEKKFGGTLEEKTRESKDATGNSDSTTNATDYNTTKTHERTTRIAKMEELEKERIMKTEEFKRQRLATMEEFERQKIAPEIESKVIANKRKVLENERLQAEIQYDNMIRVRGYRDAGVLWKMIARINKDYIPFFQDNEIKPAERTMYEEMYNKYLILKNQKSNFKF
jgi:hypothetical protein